MVAVEVFDPVLTLAIACLVELLHNLCAGGFGPAIMRIDIVNEDGQTLSSAAELLRTRAIAPGTCPSMITALPKRICAPSMGSP